MTDQEEAQCREAWDIKHAAQSQEFRDYYWKNGGADDFRQGFAAGITARPEPVMGEVYIHEKADNHYSVKIRMPRHGDILVAAYHSRAEAEQYLSQFPKREGQEDSFVRLDETRDGVWAHFSALGKSYSVNLSVDDFSRPFALAYHATTHTKPQPDNPSDESAPTGELK